MTPAGERSKKWRTAHKEEAAAYNATYYRTNKAAMKTQMAEYRAKNKEEIKKKMADNHLRRKYGLSREDYTALLLAQNGCCAICGSSSPKGPQGTFLVDHDHGTNTVRGLLCHPCNVGLGFFQDTPETLTKAAAYLVRAATALRESRS